MCANQNYDYEERIVVFLDILGFREKVFQSKEKAAKVIMDIDNALKHSLECLKINAGDDWFSVKMFSDCLCLSCEDINSNLFYMLSELSFLQFFLAESGIFVNGGLSCGYHFENDRIIFSEGLIKAYDIQNSNRFPSIVIDNEVVSRIHDEPIKHYCESLNEYIILGPDGNFFIDYFQCVFEYESYTGLGDLLFEAHKGAILGELNANKGNPRVIEKFKWLAEYHNLKFSELYNSDDWENDYFCELEKRLVISPDNFPTFKK